MKCYVCAKEGKESDAVAVCVACGMGTCMKHTIRKEVDVWEGELSAPLPETAQEDAPDALPGLQCSVRGGEVMASLAKRSIAEWRGTALLVYFGAGAAAITLMIAERDKTGNTVQHRDWRARRARRLVCDRDLVRHRDCCGHLCARPGLRGAYQPGGDDCALGNEDGSPPVMPVRISSPSALVQRSGACSSS